MYEINTPELIILDRVKENPAAVTRMERMMSSILVTAAWLKLMTPGWQKSSENDNGTPSLCVQGSSR